MHLDSCKSYSCCWKRKVATVHKVGVDKGAKFKKTNAGSIAKGGDGASQNTSYWIRQRHEVVTPGIHVKEYRDIPFVIISRCLGQ
jgi:hypothetical protein